MGRVGAGRAVRDVLARLVIPGRVEVRYLRAAILGSDGSCGLGLSVGSLPETRPAAMFTPQLVWEGAHAAVVKGNSGALRRLRVFVRQAGTGEAGRAGFGSEQRPVCDGFTKRDIRRSLVRISNDGGTPTAALVTTLDGQDAGAFIVTSDGAARSSSRRPRPAMCTSPSAHPRRGSSRASCASLPTQRQRRSRSPARRMVARDCRSRAHPPFPASSSECSRSGS